MKATLYISFVLAFFLCGLAYLIIHGNGFQTDLNAFMEFAKTPAGVMTWVDLYAGFLIMIGWYFYRDGFGPKAIILAILTLSLGNIIPLLYILYLLVKTRGDVWETLLGRKV